MHGQAVLISVRAFDDGAGKKRIPPIGRAFNDGSREKFVPPIGRAFDDGAECVCFVGWGLG